MDIHMPVAILCGGRGTRLGQHSVPKGLIEIGGRPILWHIMKLYAAQGYKEFVLCLGFGGGMIEEAFSYQEPEGWAEKDWKIHFVDTGLDTQTGGRIKKVADLVGDTFMATYGDGVARIDLADLVQHHRRGEKLATITCARARIPFGLVKIGPDSAVDGFDEKPMLDQWINGGFFVFEKGVLDYLTEDSVLETEPFERLAADGQMNAYQLEEFWACMDTYKEALTLNELWDSGAPWKVWD